MTEKRLLNIPELMSYLGYGRNTILKLIKDGKFKNVSETRERKFDKNDVDNYIELQKKTIITELKAS